MTITRTMRRKDTGSKPTFARKAMRACWGILILGAFGFTAQPIQGTTVKSLSDADLCEAATQIFHGVCLDARSEWDARGRLVTRYRFAVNEGLKGSGNSITEFIQPGGQIGDRALIVPGAATFSLNEEAVVFVGRSCARTGCAFTVGLSQGKFSVKRDPSTQVSFASRDLEELEFVGEKPKKVRQLGELLQTIRGHVSRLGETR